MAIITAALVLGAMALIFGLLLTFVSKKFAVPANPTRDAIREVLPGANCGGCGYPGCDGCADAIAAGKAPANACPVGGAEAGAKIAKILGVEAAVGAKKVARVVCQGSADHCGEKFEYNSMQDCVTASILQGGNKNCQFACLGLGTCAKACPFDAIHVDPVKKIAVVDEEKCQACGKCVAACPKSVLTLAAVDEPTKVLCRNTGKGPAVKQACDVGCIGCGLCAKNCKFDAITMVNNVPVIDQSKCVGCLMCAEKCPTHALVADFGARLKADIDPDKCVGCGICKKQCQFDAIEGELKQKHVVHDACTGCGLCSKKCPRKAINMQVRTSARNPKDVVVNAAPAAKPAMDPEMQAKIEAAKKAKAEREAAAAKENN